MPSTPGNLESACPQKSGRPVKNQLDRKGGDQKNGPGLSRKRMGGRLVGASAIHLYFPRNPPLRYPWTCSLRTRGFRCHHLLQKKNPIVFFPGGGTFVLSPYSLPLRIKLSLWGRPIATYCARTTILRLSFAAADQLIQATHAKR